MVLPLRFPKLWLALGWALVAIALYVCLTPNGVPGTQGVNDKLLHATGYFGLTAWFTGIYPRERYPLIAVLLLVMGIVVELLQGAMHAGREADVLDVAANTLGVVVAIILALSVLGGWIQRVESWIAPGG